MKYKISQLATVFQGSILTRIKSTSSTGVTSQTITMQELSYYCNQSDEIGSTNTILIDNERYKNCFFSQTGDVLVGLSSGNSMVIDQERSGKLVLSNFVIIRINDFNKLDPYYLCWLLNESNDVRRQVNFLYQKTSRVVVIPISELKDIEVECCDISKQRQIGMTYNLTRRLVRIKRLKIDVANKLVNHCLNNQINVNKGEIK